MPGARKRNDVPRILEIPETGEKPAEILPHKVIADEKNDFQLDHEIGTLNDPKKYWSFVFEKEMDILHVYFAYKYSQHGQPKRDEHRRKIFSLETNEWGRFHINGRFSSYRGQHYRQHFVNIGYFEKCNPIIFVNSKPKIQINEMDDLF